MHNEHMTKSALPKPIIIDLPYQSIDDKAEIEKAFVEQLGYETLSAVERETLHSIFDYPTVYVVHSKKRNQHTLRPEYTVYVGETNNIRSRTMQHLREDPKTRVDWKEFQENLQSDARSVVVPEKLRTLDHGRPWSDDQFASTRLSSNRDMSR